MGAVDVRGTADLSPGTSVSATQASFSGGSGAAAAGDTLYVLLASKRSTTSPTVDSGGLTLVGSVVVGTGSAGTGTGPIRLSLYKLALTGSSFSFGITAPGTGAVTAGGAIVVRPAASESITELWTTASDTSMGLDTAYSGSGLAVAVNNLLVFLGAGTSQPSFSSPTLAIANATYGTLTTFGGTGSSVGDDLRTYNARRPVATVTSTPSVPSFSATTSADSSGGGLFLFVQSVSPSVSRSGGTTATGVVASSRVNAAPASPQRSGGTTAEGVLAGSQTVPSMGVPRSGGTTAEGGLDGSRTVVVLGDDRSGATTAEGVLGGSQAVTQPEQPARSGGITATGTLAGAATVELPPDYPRTAEILGHVKLGGSWDFAEDTRNLPRYAMPARRPAVRWLAQDILTRDWITTDLKVGDPAVTEELSAPATLEFSMDAGELARLPLRPWGTYIHVEVDGAIRGSGILMPWSWGGQDIKLTARGVTCYPNGMPYQGTLTMAGESGLIGVGLDPLDVVRHIWAHLQSQPGGNLGVVLDATKSLVRIGTATDETATNTETTPSSGPAPQVVSNDPVDPRMSTIRLKAQQISADADFLQDDLTLPTDTLVLIATDANYIVSLAGEAISEDPGRYGSGKVVTLDDYASGPYSALNWWENTDCGSEVGNLAADTPFDYLEAPAWSTDRTDVVQRVRIGWPRLGRQPRWVAFTEGVNLVEALTPIERDDAYASDVIVLGKGEGPTMVRGSAGVPRDGRVRRVYTVEDGTIAAGDAAIRRAEIERLRRQGLMSFESATVRTTHPASRLGSFRPGDDVPVRCTVRGLGDVSILHRVTSIRYVPGEDTAEVSLERTDTLRYGAGPIADSPPFIPAILAISPLYPSDELYPSEDLFPIGG